jgi:hypothetical protein
MSSCGTQTARVGTSIVPPRVFFSTHAPALNVPITGSGTDSTCLIARATRIPGKTGLPDPMNASSSVAGYSCLKASSDSPCCVRICIRRHSSCSGVSPSTSVSISSSSPYGPCPSSRSMKSCRASGEWNAI